MRSTGHLVQARQSLSALAIATAIASVALQTVAAQTPSATSSKKKAPAPIAADGHPDLTGTWDYRTVTPMERPNELAGKPQLSDEEAAEYAQQAVQSRNQDRRDGAGTDADVARAYNDFWWDRGTTVVGTRRTSLIVDPPDGRMPPLTPEGRKRAANDRRAGGGGTGGVDGRGGRADGPEDRPLGERCITFGVPRVSGAYNNNMLIVQTPGAVAIMSEMIHEVRIVPLDGRPHLPADHRQWLGDSRGRWEGQTLVVETTNFSPKTNFRGAGENLHLVERFTRVDADTVDYEFTIDDPTTFTKSWTAAFPMTRNPGELFEYACHEGNYGMFGLLSGARAQEKSAADAARKGSN
jgi:hypothetical protein